MSLSEKSLIGKVVTCTGFCWDEIDDNVYVKTIKANVSNIKDLKYIKDMNGKFCEVNKIWHRGAVDVTTLSGESKQWSLSSMAMVSEAEWEAEQQRLAESALARLSTETLLAELTRRTASVSAAAVNTKRAAETSK